MKQIEDIKTIYKRADNWLFPEVALLTPNPDEITTAKKAILKLLTDKPDACLSFSSGKDSLLLALLTFEVCNENGLPLPGLLTSLTGYEKNNGFYHNTILDAVGKTFNIDAYKPAPLARYSVRVLGVGVQPLNSARFKDCLKQWKILVLPQNIPMLTGVRLDESALRAKRYHDKTADQWFSNVCNNPTSAPCLNVSSVTCWDYLKRNVYKIGADIDFILDAYKGWGRDGCWCCRWNRDPLTPFQEEINRLARKWGRWYLDNRSYLNTFPNPKRRPRATLKYKKIIYNEVRDLEEKHNVKAIQPLSDDLIKECWNFQECYLNGDDDNENNPFNRLSLKLFFEYKDDYIKNKALRPDLFNVVFQPNKRTPCGFSYIHNQKAFEYRNGKKIVYNE